MPEILSKRAFQYYWFGFAFTSSVNNVQYSSQPQQNIVYGIPATGASTSGPTTNNRGDKSSATFQRVIYRATKLRRRDEKEK